MNMKMYWNQQRIDIRRLHLIVLLGSVDPLQIQKIYLCACLFRESNPSMLSFHFKIFFFSLHMEEK